MTETRGKLYTIPPGAPFLDVLVSAILKGDLSGDLSGDLPGGSRAAPTPLELAGYTLYLPTRRACRAAHEAFLRAGGQATLLPRLRALGDVDEPTLLLSSPPETDAPALTGDAPRAIDPLERLTVLARMTLTWMQGLQRGAGVWAGSPTDLFARATPASALELAFELARLADQTQIEGRSLSGLEALAPDAFANHWRLTLDFLQIVAAQWPHYLAAADAVDPMERRNRLLALEADRLAGAAGPPLRAPEPVIIAGISHCAPPTLGLMKAVLATPRGAIVMPGLDLDLDEPAWRALTPHHPEHPQFGLKQILDGLGVAPADVACLPGAGTTPEAHGRQDAHGRQTFLREALRPARTTGLWRKALDSMDRAAIQAALEPVSLIEAPTPQDESWVIALLLREAAETPGRTASLVTPDRSLARRVTALLRRWDIVIDDSGGSPLARSREGAFLDLIAEAALTGSPVAFLSLLKHPLARLDLPRPELRARARVLELMAIRRPQTGGGLGGLRRSFAEAEDALASGALRHPALGRLTPEQRRDASDLIDRLTRAFAPLTALQEAGAGPSPQEERFQDGRHDARPEGRHDGRHPLASLARAHGAVAEALATSEDSPPAALWSGAAGSVLQTLLDRLADPALPAPAIRFDEYPAAYRSLVRREVIRPTRPAHPRLAIWGPLEARLLRPDLVILGGLNEGVWPEAADSGPWLSRPMRAQLGLPPPEQRIGMAAHDFTQLMGADEVVLTRALKAGSVPTRPSRWLARIGVLLDGLALDRADPPALAPDRDWLNWALTLRNTPAQRPARGAPAPRPPVAARPRRLAVTAIETWLANPYAIFARHILDLAPLPVLAGEPAASDRGQIIHAALAAFCRRYPTALPPDAAGELVHLAMTLLARLGNSPRARAFWRPRFERFSQWFAETEAERRSGVLKTLGEVRGTLVLDAPAGPFTLTARADRIDIDASGALLIYDYKSGSPPIEAAVVDFRSPQLPLEALIALEGGFSLTAGRAAPPGVRTEVARLAYISATGGTPPGEERDITRCTPAQLAETARAGLAQLIARFDLQDTPYRALRRPAFEAAYRYDAYAHLARVAEWRTAEREES